MLVSFPLLAARRSLYQSIAASGVSDIDLAETPAPAPAWRSAPPSGNPYLDPAPTCPECGGRVVRASACLMCHSCGWGRCG